MEQFTIHRDNEANLTFTGELIASAATSENNAHPDYSGTAGRWQELALYKTEGGKLVCSRVERTCWQGEHDHHTAAVCDDPAGVVAFFGYDRLAMQLYDEADIDAAERIE
jgi:hypothetical protein